MNLQEINRRLDVLNKKKIPVINRRMLQGGMQERLRRQDVRRYARDIDKQKKDLNDKIDLLETSDSDFSIMSFSSNIVSNEKFNEPKLKRIRNSRSFF